jgi:peptidoglycan/xylan/chitin deacetylase (PgdA/CDA1 family)
MNIFRPRRSMLRVLTYHRIADPKDAPLLDPRLISATPAAFERQMRYLAKHYRVVSVEEVLFAVESGTRLPERAILITFDDAYCDLTQHAWPTLKRLRLPATIFVPTAYPDQPERAFWADRLYRAFFHTPLTQLPSTPMGPLSLNTPAERRHSLRRLHSYLRTIAHTQAVTVIDEICAQLDGSYVVQKSVLSWEELRQLAREGVTLGAHTRTHPMMTQLSPEQIREEIIGSHSDLQREIGGALPIFCYPNGTHNDTVVDILRQEGFVIAFTTLDGHNDLHDTDPLRLRRTNITKRTSPVVFSIRLLRWATYVDAWRHRKLV